MINNDGVFYEGDWSDYYVDTDSLDINEKIKRTLELEGIQEEIKRKKFSVLSWISVPFILLALMILMLLINAIPITVIRYIVMFIFSAVAILILGPIAIKPKNRVKFKWRRWVLVVILWLAALNSVKAPAAGSPYTIISLALFIGIIFLLSVVFMLIYTPMSRAGYEEMLITSKNEKDFLTNDIYKKINSGRLEPIKLDYDVILSEDEIPLLEMESVLIKSMKVEEYYRNTQAANEVKNINMGSWFDMGKFSINKNKILEDVNNIASNISYGINNAFKKTEEEVKKPDYYDIPSGDNTEYYDRVGKLILTSDRILFVGSSLGFQIFYTELASCALSRNQKEILSLETEDTIKILATDFSYWVKLYVDRLALDARQKS